MWVQAAAHGYQSHACFAPVPSPSATCYHMFVCNQEFNLLTDKISKNITYKLSKI